AFQLNMEGDITLDIGASTGGFTDCMLKNGAVKTYAVDVGYGQLDWKLRNDSRVINMEKTNIRYVTKEDIPDPIDFTSIDVSFISLTLVLPVAYELLKENGELVCLIKPQFEAGRQQVGKNGIVRDKKIHIEVIHKITSFASELGFAVKALTFSPVKGTKGNIEYLLHLQKSEESCDSIHNVEDTVESAHLELKK
ncbi:MAG: TlyA family RNA methyltransferase, partial [Clostridia bacterium]|nr:TlyA family RNA methyltransferase [Clostridia bacterium]